jgi:hypothetical protein
MKRADHPVSMISLLVVDDHAMVRMGLRAMLALEPDFFSHAGAENRAVRDADELGFLGGSAAFHERGIPRDQTVGEILGKKRVPWRWSNRCRNWPGLAPRPTLL